MVADPCGFVKVKQFFQRGDGHHERAGKPRIVKPRKEKQSSNRKMYGFSALMRAEYPVCIGIKWSKTC